MRTYLEIGSNNFDTLNDKFADRFNWCGVSIEAVPEYFDNLVQHGKNTYINAICTVEESGPRVFYYVPADAIEKYNLPHWLSGCGSLDLHKQPSLMAYKEYVVSQELETISLAAVLKLVPKLDLLKIDTEGYDLQLLNAILDKTLPTNIIFETVFMSQEDFKLLDIRLRTLGYTYKGRDGDSVQYSIPSTLLIVDSNWSTGSIAKDLKYISKSRHIDYLDWGKYIEPAELNKIISEYDSAVSFCLSSPHKWMTLANYGVVCCGKIEVDWIKNTGLLGNCFSAVSYETYCELLKISSKPVYYTPASVRLSRFVAQETRPIKILGWCGVPASAQNFGGVDAKRFYMFEEIVKQTGLQYKVSNQDYTYDNIQEFYDSIDLLICTSSTEGGPLGVFEAVACGIPVISTNVGLVKECDSIYKFETVQQACDIIEKLNGEFLQDYISRQYSQVCSEINMEHTIEDWNKFFLACDCLNTPTLLF
jgi:glycosyltransferase involved in cell wall biosynthesis